MSESEHHLATSADPKVIRQRVRAIVQSLNRMRRSEAYWHVGSVIGEVRRVLEQAWELLRADDGQQALPWVIQACRQQAEYLMNGAKAQYYYAVHAWLAKARQAYRALGREAEWQSYLNELLQMHRLKQKLVPLLKDLR
ncbi:MAG TPA: hypothetical protein VGN34_01205 [Ktedonobacteraceae bacterium]|jgi:hypothetical protein